MASRRVFPGMWEALDPNKQKYQHKSQTKLDKIEYTIKHAAKGKVRHSISENNNYISVLA